MYAQNAVGQRTTITVIADTTTNTAYRNTILNVFQGNRLIKASLNQSAIVQKGIVFELEFENKLIKIPGYKNLKIFSDTAIALGFISLQEVIVKNKKKIVSESLTGFTYYPQNDSIFKDKSILLAMQRLPFITVTDENTIPKYKFDSRILFLINGKQKKGLENGWVDVLRAIKAKDIYKVELLEEIPQLYKNQGYTTVINIYTLDENIYGESFNAAIIYNQRNAVNLSTRTSLLRRKSDLTLEATAYNDNFKQQMLSGIYRDDTLIAENRTEYNYKFKHARITADYGYRINAKNDFAFNISLRKGEANSAYNNRYGFPVIPGNTKIKTGYEGVNLNTSHIYRKTKDITKSFSFAATIESSPVNNWLAYLNTKTYDSINKQNSTRETYWIAEYNIQNNTKPNFQKEIGLQVYNKKLHQDYELYNIDSINDKNGQLLFKNNDTLNLKQISVRPYYRGGKNISNTKRLTFVFFSELYMFRPANGQNRIFYLPRVRSTYKKVISDKLSIRNVIDFSFDKPSVDYLLPVQANADPFEKQIGNTNLKPSKNVFYSFEFVGRKKSTYSVTSTLYYSFDGFGFFRVYDATNNKLVNTVNNDKIYKGVFINFSYQFPVSKKFSGSVSTGLVYAKSKNKSLSTSYAAFAYSGSSFFRYTISPKKGSISFSSLLNGNYNNGQGFQTGVTRYSLDYGNNIFNKHFALTLSAENFLLKDRKRLTYTFNSNYKNYSYVISPYRLISIRLGYNFSNIKVVKLADKKTTEIIGERTRDK